MSALIDLFTSEGLCNTHHYRQGHQFELSGYIGLVLSGLVAVEGLANTADASPVTVRLVKAGSFLNMGNLNKTQTKAQNYYVESEAASISQMSAEHLRKLLASGDLCSRAGLQSGILEAVCKEAEELTETVGYLEGCRGKQKVAWAKARLEGVEISALRLASHIGADAMTVYRGLKGLA
ncbi:MAG: hypothetical protein ABL884_12940 [Methyloglobulus sp.]